MSNSWRANNRRFYRADSQIIIVRIQFIVNERLIEILCVVMWSSNQKLIEDLFKTVSVIRAIAHTGRVTGAGGGRFNGHWAPVIHKSNRRLAVSNTGLTASPAGLEVLPLWAWSILGRPRGFVILEYLKDGSSKLSCQWLNNAAGDRTTDST